MKNKNITKPTMKRFNHLHKILSGLIPSLLLLSSCTAEDMPQAEGTPLPEGKYPLNLTATVSNIKARATGKDTWTEGDEVAVRIGNDGKTSKYVISSNNSLKPASDEETLYWQNTAPATISAWYPYETQNNIDISNQENGFADFDFLTAVAEDQTYQNSTELKFKHQMSKVKCVLVKGDGVTDEELAQATVQIYGFTQANFEEGTLTGAENGWISTAAAREALLVPQDVTNKEFIKVSIDNNEFYYTPTTATAGSLLAGHRHTYTIAVNDYGIDVKCATSDEWTLLGEETVNTDRLVASYTATDLKFGDYYYSDGTYSDGGVRKIFIDEFDSYSIIDKEDIAPLKDKEVIGYVIYAGHHENDKSDYSNTGIGKEKCNGYVIAYSKANQSTNIWGPSTELGLYDKTVNDFIDWSGYKYTQKIIEAAGGIDNLNPTEISGYPATYFAVVDYDTQVKAPESSSGWFLPSSGQLYHFVKIAKLYSNPLMEFFVDHCAYTSSEYNYTADRRFISISYIDNYIYNFNIGKDGTDVRYTPVIIPVLAF